MWTNWVFWACFVCVLLPFFWGWRSSGTPTTTVLPADLKPEDIDWLRRHFELCEGRGITMQLPVKPLPVRQPRIVPVVGGPGGPPKGRGAGSPHPNQQLFSNRACRCWECKNVHDKPAFAIDPNWTESNT